MRATRALGQAQTSAGTDQPPCTPGRKIGLFWPWLGLIALAALLLQLAFADRYPLSMDEAFSRYWAEFPQAFLWGEGRRIELNPPLYYALLRLWTAMFGFSDLALRTLSVLASAATLLLCGLLGRRVLGPAGGLLTAAAFALLPLSVWHALDARPASFVLVFEVTALWAAFTYLHRLDRQGGEDAQFSRGERLALVAIFAAASVLAVHTHATAMFFAAAAGGATFASLLPRRAAGWIDRTIWLVGGATIIVLCTPQILIFAGQSRTLNPMQVGHGQWFWTLQAFAAPLLLGRGVFEITPLLRLLLVAGLLVAAMFGATRLRGRAATVALLAIPACYLALLLASSTLRLTLLPRAGLILLVPFAIALAAAVLTLPRASLRGLAAAALAVPLLVGHALQWSDPPTMGSTHALRHEYRGVVRFLAGAEQCQGDIFAGHPWNLLGWPHYGPLPRGARPVVVRLPEEGDVEADYAISRFAPRLGLSFIDLEEFRERGGRERTMIVLVGQATPSRRTMEQLLAGMQDRFAITRHDLGTGNNRIAVHCLVRRPG